MEEMKYLKSDTAKMIYNSHQTKTNAIKFDKKNKD